MHLLLIFLLLVIAFPLLARLVGSIVRLMFWLFVASTVVAMVKAIVD
jgi:hypothetical protein